MNTCVTKVNSTEEGKKNEPVISEAYPPIYKPGTPYAHKYFHLLGEIVKDGDSLLDICDVKDPPAKFLLLQCPRDNNDQRVFDLNDGRW